MEVDDAAGTESTRPVAGAAASRIELPPILNLNRGAGHGSVRAELALSALLLAAGGAALIGLWLRSSDPTLGFSFGAAMTAVQGQLAVTVPAALLAGAATALDIAAGTMLLRALRRAPFATASDAILGGLAGAILIDALLLFVLGSVGLFRWPVVGAALVAIAAAGVRVRPIVARRPRIGRIRPARWLLVAIVWAGPVILTLASPVVPFADVLPNHVAPAEHIRVFGDFASLATDPSPIYGSTRIFLGDTALLGTLATLTGLQAVLAVAAFAIPLLLLSGLAVARAASAAFGRSAAYWALVAFPLSFTFVRLSDSRDSVTALPLAALAFSLLMARPRNDAINRPPADRPDWLLAFVLTAAVLVHPLVGALAIATVVVVTLADPARFASRVVPAVIGAAAACLPQGALMIGLMPPAFVGIVGLAAGAATLVLAAAAMPRLMPIAASIHRSRALPAVVAAALLAILLVELTLPDALPSAERNLRANFPVLFLGAAIVALGILPTRRGGRNVVVAGVAVGLAALVAVAVLPGESLTIQSIRYEVPKAIGYWLPWVCVPAAAGVLAGLWRWRGPVAIRLVTIAIILGVAVWPLSAAVPNTTQASHPAADALAYDLRTAETGYWVGYPNSRLLLAATEEDLVNHIRSLEASGQLGPHDGVLHVAASFQPWLSIPVGVFTGAIETMVSIDAAPTIFTTGDRLLPLATLGPELTANFRYVLLEPAGLPPEIRAEIVAAGYRSIFANFQGELFTRE